MLVEGLRRAITGPLLSADRVLSRAEELSTDIRPETLSRVLDHAGLDF